MIPHDEVQAAWNQVLVLKARNETLLDTVAEITRLVRGCQPGEEVHTIKMLRELLGLPALFV